MNDIKNSQKHLLDHAAKEQSFRKQIIADIAQLLRNPTTDPTLKLFIILGLLVVVGISFVFSIFLVHAVYALWVPGAEFHPEKYGYIILVQLLCLMGISIPLVLQASKAEQALRLEDSFNKIYDARFGK